MYHKHNDIKMEELFVTYPLAQKLKELGFNSPCVAFFDGNGKFTFSPNNPTIYTVKTLAPTWEQAFNFLETKNILVSFPLVKLKRFIDIWEKAKESGSVVSSRVYFSSTGFKDKHKLNIKALTKAISLVK